jgi:hypothetical protein
VVIRRVRGSCRLPRFVDNSEDGKIVRQEQFGVAAQVSRIIRLVFLGVRGAPGLL